MTRQTHDLGNLRAGNLVKVSITGTEINLVLLDAHNARRYLRGESFKYEGGGHYKESPAEIVVPRDGHWFLGVDLGGGAGNSTYRIAVV